MGFGRVGGQQGISSRDITQAPFFFPTKAKFRQLKVQKPSGQIAI